MNRHDYIAEVDAIHAPNELRARIAALEHAPAPRARRGGRWLPLAACLVLLAALSACLPAILRQLSLGGQLDPPSVTTAPIASHEPQQSPIPDGELTALLAAEFPDPQPNDSWELLLSQPGEGRTLGVLRYTCAYHAGGYGNLIIGIFDNGSRTLAEPVKFLRGDRGTVFAWNDAQTLQFYILCTSIYEAQGWQDCTAALFTFNGSQLDTVRKLPEAALDSGADLPDGAETMFDDEINADFWADHKGVINGAGLDIYHRDPEKGSYSDDAWIFDCHLPLGTPMDDTAPVPVEFPQPGEGFESYTGSPLLALTVEPSGGGSPEDIAVERVLTFDFTETFPNYTPGSCPLVTDRYVLRNTTGRDQSLTLFYPFSGSFQRGENSFIPTVTVDGAAVPRTNLKAGAVLSNDENWSIPTWEAYAAALDGGSAYLRDCLSPAQMLIRDLPAHTYIVRDIQGFRDNPDLRDPASATLAFDLVLADPEHTQILTYGIDDSGQVGSDNPHFDFYLSADRKPVQYIILVGGDLESFSVTGYQDGACTPGSEVSSLTARLSPAPATAVAEGTLGAAMYHIVDAYLNSSNYTTILDMSGELDTSVFVDAIATLLTTSVRGRGMVDSGYGASLGGEVFVDPRYASGRLEAILDDVFLSGRVLYYYDYVSIPAGGSVTVKSVFHHGGHTSRGLEEPADTVLGFDFSPALGSSVVPEQFQVQIIPDGSRSVISTNLELLQDSAHGITYLADPKIERCFFEMQ